MDLTVSAGQVVELSTNAFDRANAFLVNASRPGYGVRPSAAAIKRPFGTRDAMLTIAYSGTMPV
jgi:hypothetical protein